VTFPTEIAKPTECVEYRGLSRHALSAVALQRVIRPDRQRLRRVDALKTS